MLQKWTKMGLNKSPKFPKNMSKIQGLGSSGRFLKRRVGCTMELAQRRRRAVQPCRVELDGKSGSFGKVHLFNFLLKVKELKGSASLYIKSFSTPSLFPGNVHCTTSNFVKDNVFLPLKHFLLLSCQSKVDSSDIHTTNNFRNKSL